MARAALTFCADENRTVAGGIVVGAAAPPALPGTLSPLELLTGDHPVPHDRSARAAEQLEEQCDQTGPDDIAIVLISGGTSALVGAPVFGVSQGDLSALHELLIGAGLDITRVNTVRKRFSKWGAGRLAAALAPARVYPILLSDVPGDDAAAIGSGPCSPDPHSAADVEQILRDAEIARSVPLALAAYLGAVIAGSIPETPKSKSVVFANVHEPIIGSNATALAAAERAAAAHGAAFGIQRVVLNHRPVVGDATDAGHSIARALLASTPGSCLLFSGETTVRLPHPHGLGGRNQQLALAAAQTLEDHGVPSSPIAILAAGTDGRDGPTDAAGAVITQNSWGDIAAAGRSPRSDLDGCDAYPALDSAGALLRTGLTGTNVGDVIIALRGQSV